MSFNKKPKAKSEDIKKFIHEPVSGSNQYKKENNTNPSINTNTSANTKFPWEQFSIRSKQRSVFNIRFNEYYEAAYKYFSAQQGFDSYQLFVRGVIEKELDRLIKQETNERKNS